MGILLEMNNKHDMLYDWTDMKRIIVHLYTIMAYEMKKMENAELGNFSHVPVLVYLGIQSFSFFTPAKYWKLSMNLLKMKAFSKKVIKFWIPTARFVIIHKRFSSRSFWPYRHVNRYVPTKFYIKWSIYSSVNRTICYSWWKEVPFQVVHNNR